MRQMKDSGIPWVGEIPETWEVMANKYVMTKIKHIKPLYCEEDILSLTMNGVIVRDLDAGGKMPASFNGYQTLYPGNLLMCLFDYDVTPRCIGLIKNNGVTSPAYSQFAMKLGASANYFYYYYLMVDFDKSLLHLAKNLRHSFTEDQLGAISVPVPPLSEQTSIATYLDAKCAEIDALSADVQSEIDLLESYKRSVITEAVTKGLDKNAAMKDSGIPWVGEIPETWKVSRVKYLFRSGKGLSITKENLIDTGLPVISYGQIHSKTNSGIEIKENLLRYVDYSYQQLYPQSKVDLYDFVFADTSEDYEGIGNCVYQRNSNLLFAGYHAIILKAKTKCDNRYLAFLFKTDSWRKQLRESASGVKVFSISQRALLNASVILPPLLERKRISDYLDAKCAEIDAVIEQKREQIAVLSDYKKSVIYEYVTGKKEVPAR